MSAFAFQLLGGHSLHLFASLGQCPPCRDSSTAIRTSLHSPHNLGSWQFHLAPSGLAVSFWQGLGSSSLHLPTSVSPCNFLVALLYCPPVWAKTWSAFGQFLVAILYICFPVWPVSPPCGRCPSAFLSPGLATVSAFWQKQYLPMIHLPRCRFTAINCLGSMVV